MSHEKTRRRKRDGASGGKPSLNQIRLIYDFLTPKERRRGALVVAVVVFSAFVETIGVASVLPFLSVLGNPQAVENDERLRWIYETLNFSSPDRFLLFLGLGSVILVVGSGATRLAKEYMMVRFAEMERHAISYRLLKLYLRQPYEFFLNRNSADLSKGILSEVDDVVTNVIYPALTIPAYGSLSLLLVVLLVAVDPLAATIAAVVVGGVYGATYLAVSRTMRRRGKDRVRANRGRFTTAAEAFGGIKDLKLLAREDAYLDRFRQPSMRFSKHRAFARILSRVPRYAIEGVGFGGILIYALVLMAAGDDVGRILPVLGLYVFAGYKLLPSVHNVYSYSASLRFGLPALENLNADVQALSSARPPRRSEAGRIDLVTGIEWSEVSFQYPGSETTVLKDISLRINPGTTVAFVGPTGAGKTTAVDLILGLLKPTTGEIRVNDTPMEGVELRRWQNSIGYVPQHIYLADDTVAANIAFGVRVDEIDHAAVEHAARLASLHDFIVDELPDGYASLVGERGVRISGGQRQRLGIARALYTEPDVLVLDEATSALDSVTEEAVMDAVYTLGDEKTVILIAHRLSTVRRADRIFFLEAGRLIDTGSFEEIAVRNTRFRQMAAGALTAEVQNTRASAATQE